MSPREEQHVAAAYRFELGKVEHEEIRARVVDHLNHVDHDLAVAVAAGIGVAAPGKALDNHGRSSPPLSQANAPHDRRCSPRRTCRWPPPRSPAR